jgi:hypothetical protein
MAGWGALLERRRWLVPVEVCRAASVVASLVLFANA